MIRGPWADEEAESKKIEMEGGREGGHRIIK